MDENDSQGRDRRQSQGDFKSRLITRFLTPIAAAAASAAAGYAAKKAPDFFERTLQVVARRPVGRYRHDRLVPGARNTNPERISPTASPSSLRSAPCRQSAASCP